MKKIMVDMDDVIVDQAGWMHIINTFLNANYTIDDVNGYYIQDIVPKDKMDEYTKYFITQNTYDYCNLNEGCFEVLEKLNKKYDVYVFSAYVFRDDLLYSASALKYKFEYLHKNLPFLDPKKFIFTNDKSIVKADIKIDDIPSNLTNADTKLLFTCWHNKNINDKELLKKNIKRVNSWKDIEKILL